MNNNICNVAIIAAIFLILIGCNGSSKQNSEQPKKVESKMTNEVEDAIKNFTSIDLQMFGLKGHVKTVKLEKKEKDSDAEVIMYDEVGRLIKYKQINIIYDRSEKGMVAAQNGLTLVRDKQGRITEMPLSGGCGGNYGYFFVYDNQGLISEEINDEYGECTGIPSLKFKYNDSGCCKTASIKVGDESGSFESLKTFSQYKYDKYGNWIERSYNDKETNSEYMGDDEEKVTNTETKGVEKRTITYY